MAVPSPTPPPTTLSAPLANTPFLTRDQAIYVITDKGLLRRIPDTETLRALGYEPEQIITYPDELLAPYALASDLTHWLDSADEYTLLYYLDQGTRRDVPDLEMALAMNADLLDIIPADSSLASDLPHFDQPLPHATRTPDQISHPRTTAIAWAHGQLWTANESGRLTTWGEGDWQLANPFLPENTSIRAIAEAGDKILVGTEDGAIWEMAADGTRTLKLQSPDGWVSAILAEPDRLWYADTNHYDARRMHYRPGLGLIERSPDGREQIHRLGESSDGDTDPLQAVTALALSTDGEILWAGTRFGGLLQFDRSQQSWRQHTTFNSELGDNNIRDLELAANGSLWLATASGLFHLAGQTWENTRLVGGENPGVQSLATTEDGTIWVAGKDYLAFQYPDEPWQIFRDEDYPIIRDRHQAVASDEHGLPWFVGRGGKLRFDGTSWSAIDIDVRRTAHFTLGQAPNLQPLPNTFPSPVHYDAWLQTWPRPHADNGWCMHFLQTHRFDAIEAQQQINRLKRLGAHWSTVLYVNHEQLRLAAPLFQEAGIQVLWRPFVRPYESYDDWERDVAYLNDRGIPPYFQLYNEPGLAQEWSGQRIDFDLFINHLLPAVDRVYNAGGYVGLQFLDPAWLRQTLKTMQMSGQEYTFDRLFFIPHPYGLNHPPDYIEDRSAALGFLAFADVFEKAIGFVPPMIAGEGGWKIGSAQDDRYPPVNEIMHRDYHLAALDWFRSGQLSAGGATPDYLFAYCPWLISDPVDDAAWFDSDAGARTLTIEAFESQEPFVRRFSWSSEPDQ